MYLYSNTQTTCLREAISISTPSYIPLFTPISRVRDDAGITEEDLPNLTVYERIRNAEYWAIGALKRVELWTSVQNRIQQGEIFEDLFNATMYYASAECTQRVFGSSGERSQTNYPESFTTRSAGGLSAGQPDWRTVYNNKMTTAKKLLDDFIKYLQGEEESNENNLTAQVSNRDFDAHFDKHFGIRGADIDFF